MPAPAVKHQVRPLLRRRTEDEKTKDLGRSSERHAPWRHGTEALNDYSVQFVLGGRARDAVAVAQSGSGHVSSVSPTGNQLVAV